MSAKPGKAMFSFLRIPNAGGRRGKSLPPDLKGSMLNPCHLPQWEKVEYFSSHKKLPEKDQKLNLIMMFLQAALKSQQEKTELNLLKTLLCPYIGQHRLKYSFQITLIVPQFHFCETEQK